MMTSEAQDHSRLGIAMLIALLLAAVGLVVLTLSSWWYLRPQCDIQATQLNLVVHIKGQEPATFNDRETTDLPPIDVQVNDTVSLEAELTPQPVGCIGTFSIDWEPASLGFDLTEFKTIIETPLHKELQIKLGLRDPKAFGPDIISLIVREASGEPLRIVDIHLQERAQ